MKNIGPTFKETGKPAIYCMLGDEPLMFSPYEVMSDSHKEHVRLMRREILIFTMSILPISKKNDIFILDKAFLEYKEFFTWHKQVFKRFGLDYAKKIIFTDEEKKYPLALQKLNKTNILSSVCFSYMLDSYVDIKSQLEISKKVNSKIELVTSSKKYNFQIPHSLVFTKKEIMQMKKLPKRFSNKEFILKTDGLGGGFNVRKCTNLKDCKVFLNDFNEDTEFILQEKIDGDVFNEYISDFIIQTKKITLANTRLKLTLDNQWFGNVYLPISFNKFQLNNLMKCAKYLQKIGFCSPDGFIAGLDFFQNKKDQFIFEINARWTGGFPIAMLLKKLGVLNKIPAISYLDKIKENEIEIYKKFVETHLYSSKRDLKNGFAILPVAFSPYVEKKFLTVWFVVLGDYEKFLEAKKHLFSKESFALSNVVYDILKKSRSTL